jgi:hypothetical protein
MENRSGSGLISAYQSSPDSSLMLDTVERLHRKP